MRSRRKALFQAQVAVFVNFDFVVFFFERACGLRVEECKSKRVKEKTYTLLLCRTFTLLIINIFDNIFHKLVLV